MSNKYTNFFMALLVITVIAVIAVRYHDYVENKNYFIEINTICNPDSEKCFTSELYDYNFGYQYYKKVRILSNLKPPCLEEHNCTNFSCINLSNNPEQCEIFYCNDDSLLDENEKCVQ